MLIKPGFAARTILILLLIALLAEVFLRICGHVYLARFYYNNFISTVEPSPKDIIIVCLGESSTAGLWVNGEDSYPRQLEKKLREFYKNENIKIIVPPHLGQNTSHISNRIKNYLTLYKPKLIILMAGANNQWSLSESHSIKFIHGFKEDVLKMKCLIFLDSFRLFKAMRYFYLICANREDPVFLTAGKPGLLSEPQYSRWPPKEWIFNFAETHKEAFIKMWEHDIRRIINTAEKHDAKVLLMTYAVPIYVPFEHFVSMAKENNTCLIRNDESFSTIIESGNMREYFCKDNWHPNGRGYSIIADNAFEYIRDNDLLGLLGIGSALKM